MSRADIAFVLPRLSSGGVERVFLNLAAGLAETGAKVEVVVLDAGVERSIAVPDGVTLIDLRVPIRGDATYLLGLPAMRGYLRRSAPRVLYAGMTTINLLALWGRRLAGADTAVIVSEHVPVSVNARTHPLKRVLPLLARLSYPSADAVVAVSRDLADDLARATGLARPRVVTLYNPVVTDKLIDDAGRRPGHEWFEPAALERHPVVLGIGRLSEQKDFTTLVRAFARLRSRRSARLLILGEGPQRQELLAEISRLGLGDDVSLSGYVDDPASYLAHASLFALSSAYEGFPTVLIEALASGCPVVSTDCPTGPNEILAQGQFGPLVPVGDVEALAAAMEETLERPLPRQFLMDRGREFTVDAAVPRVLELLAQLPSRPAPRSVGTPR